MNEKEIEEWKRKTEETFRIQAEEEDRRTLEGFRKQFGSSTNILYKFKVLWHGWECDPYGWIVEQNKERFVILTNHGGAYKASIEDLIDRLTEYNNVTKETNRAIALLTGDSHE